MVWPTGRRPRKAVPPGCIDLAVPYEADKAAQRFVREHPNGATLEEVAVVCGLTRERIRQIEQSALIRLDRACRAYGLGRGLYMDGSDLGHALVELVWSERRPA